MRRYAVLLLGFVLGAVVAVLAAGALPSLREPAFKSSEPARGADTRDGNDGLIRLTPEQVSAAGISVVAAGKGELARRIALPGTVVPHADQVARVSVKLSATVAELRKKLGDLVVKGEVVAVLESREVADSKSEFLAARLTNDLQQELYQRDKVLWENKFATEQQYLRSRSAAAQAKVRLDIARQKLVAVGLDDAEIVALPDQPEASLRFQPVVAPISGRIVERKVDLGAAVGRDSLETELFVVADLGTVWVDLAASPGDLETIREGEKVVVSTRGRQRQSEGRVIFVSPMLDRETRMARVVAEIDNGDGTWRPGSFVTATIAVDAREVPLAVPVSALQTVGGQRVVFVRTAGGFEKRVVAVGRSDDRMAEITGGLKPAETVASTNTFLLKSELLKGAVED